MSPTLFTSLPLPDPRAPLLRTFVGAQMSLMELPFNERMAKRTFTPIEERAHRALDRIRPAIAADGGDVWLIRVEGATAYVQMLGACGGCPAAHLTLENGIAAAIRAEVAEITSVVAL